MNNYTFEEYCDIHYFYGLAGGSALEARRLYGERFPNRQCPNFKTFTAVHNRLREIGSFTPNKSDTGRGKSVRTVEFEENVLQQFEDSPDSSTRSVATEMGCCNKTVWNVLKSEKLHPYKLQKVQDLNPRDFPLRVHFCRWLLNKEINSPRFLEKILFTDEATFDREGIFNSRNSHMWTQDNPHGTFTRRYQTKFSVNVWVGILGNYLIGPYILPNRLNSPIYHAFLRDILPELMEDIPLEVRRNMWFQHDGAPPHFSNNVRDFLNDTYGRRWIGRGGPVNWPPRSPDLTPLDFFVWGHMKTLVYSSPILDEMDLVARVVEAAGCIKENANVFAQVRQSMHERLRLCNRRGGRHFEQLL